jgi:hypothetical protein
MHLAIKPLSACLVMLIYILLELGGGGFKEGTNILM